MGSMRTKKNKKEPMNNSEEMSKDSFYHFATRWDRTVSFWDENPDLMYMYPYRELYDNRGHRESSKILEAIFMVYSPLSSGNNSGSKKEKDLQLDTAKYFLKDKNFQWSAYRKYIEAFKKDCINTLEADKNFYIKKLDELKDHLDKTPISVDPHGQADLMKAFKMLLKDKVDIMKTVDQERKNTRLRSGIKRSRVERKPKTE